jgi:hypothetical protein
MKDQTLQLKEARQLLELGKVQEALVLAMDILWRELDQLREALEAIRENLPPDEAATAAPEDHPQRESSWPEPPSRLLH